jgi:hypothetical protein
MKRKNRKPKPKPPPVPLFSELTPPGYVLVRAHLRKRKGKGRKR